ncbi:hypothetical protein TWF703_003149 [Orbilia oligospora]|uniref:Nucleoside phosphorylase domain-containing protein n=1 Tax=Orbilia oligospora TaxID=2813651 RepID=A0A7C8NSY0_ORBOL|nr:hypothetical protein TWF703_003149 [Orbilia oligospora]
MSESYNYEDYNVAVITALDYEMSAFRYMLDKEHTTLPTKEGDTNMYILGEYNRHNIVIACLPGNQGKGAASIASTNLNRTFPCVIWRFLIGIGGAVPSFEHDIRLGDVVISMPEGIHGGVVQYDLGKDVEDGFNIKGFLVPPPTLLRNVAQVMKSNHLLQDNKVDEFISLMTKRSKRLSIFKRPSETLQPDILYAADYLHIAGERTCANCNKSRAVSREDRDVEGSVIHYGLIASGDRVVKSGTKRDKVAQRIGGVLCFEMEAAGIATELSCIVIRGISDYSDSHKNDVWHYYAAAAAAAAGKEMLSYLTPINRSSSAATSSTSSSSQKVPSAVDSWTGSRNEFSGVGMQQTGSGTISFGRDATINGRY